MSHFLKKIVYYYVESIFLYSMHSPEQTALMELRNLSLSDQEKRLLRQRVQTKQQKSLNIQKVFIALRYTGYASVGIFGLFVLASSFMPQQQRMSDSTNPLITLLTPWSQTVKADTLWRLVAIQWVVNISDNWNILPNTEIHAWQTVVLEPWAQLVVQLMGTTFATISGPATFVLEKLPETNQTVLNMLEWSLIEVTTKWSAEKNATLVSEVLETELHQEQSVQKSVIIKTKHVQVTTQSEESTTFVINQNEQSADVLATAWNIVVKQLSDTTLSQEEFVVQAWNNAHVDKTWVAIALPWSSEEVEQLATVSKNLQIRYQKTNKTNNDAPITDEPSILAYLDDPESLPLRVDSVWEEILTELAMKTKTAESKRIIPNDLRLALEKHISAYDTVYSVQLLNTITQTYVLLWLSTPAISDLESAKWAMTQLINALESTYSVPPSLIWQLHQKIALMTGTKEGNNEHQAAAVTVALDAALWADQDTGTTIEASILLSWWASGQSLEDF